MKKLIYIFVAAMMAACGAGGVNSNDPVAVAQKFADAYYSGDFDKAREMCGNNAQYHIDQTNEEYADMIKGLNIKTTYNAEESQIHDGQLALLFFDVTSKVDERLNNSRFEVTLVFDDDRWIVDNFGLK